MMSRPKNGRENAKKWEKKERVAHLNGDKRGGAYFLKEQSPKNRDKEWMEE